MINFLVVDDIVNNVEILELLISDYMEDNDIQEDNYMIYSAANGAEAVALTKENTFDMIFLDIMMPVMNGFGALSEIRQMDLPKQPIVVMATALGDAGTKEKERRKGANAYVVKPFGKKSISIILDHYMNKISNSTSNDEDFFDDDFFEFDEFDDFDSEGSIENQKEIMDKFNESHEELSNEDFLSDYDYLMDEIALDLEEIDCLLMNHFNLEDDDLDIQAQKEQIEELFSLISKLLHRFSEFDELSASIAALEELIYDLDVSKLSDEKKEEIGMYLKAIIMDINDWKEHVFVLQDTKNVFYANASLFSSYLEVKELIS